ncbi:MAG: hypothetical protein AB7P02_04900 [Alphaproteobacteria bacterium]
MAGRTNDEGAARPRLRLRIGVTGHRRLAAPDLVEAAVARILDAVTAAVAELAARAEAIAAYARTPSGTSALVSVGGLAAGADAMVADAVHRRGGAVHAVLPFAREQFEEDFRELDGEADGPALATFRRQIAAAEACFVHDGRRDGDPRIRDRAYEAVGRTVLRHSDILVAIWDGEEPRGRGGTGQVVEIAARQAIPVLWIAADTGLVRAIEGEAGIDLRPAPLDEEALRSAIARWVERAVAVPWRADERQSHGHGHEVAPGLRPVTWLLERLLGRAPSDADELRRFYAERAQRGGWRRLLRVVPVHRFLRDRITPAALLAAETDAVGRRIAGAVGPDVWSVLAEEKRGVDERRLSAGPGGALWRAMVVPDAVAVGLSEDKRSATLWVGCAAAVSIMCAATSLVVYEAKAALAVAELVLLLLVFATVLVANRRRWKERWLSYRLLAELLRAAASLAPLGRTIPVQLAIGEGHVGRAFPRWVSWLFAATARDAGLASIDMSRRDARLAALTGPAAHLVLDQILYHRGNALRVSRLAAAAEVVGELAFVATLALLAIKLTLLHFGLAKEALHWMTLATVCLPTAAAAAYAVRHVEEWALLQLRSEVMAERLERWLVDDLAPLIRADLDQDEDHPPLAMEEAARALLSVSQAMVEEVGSWLTVVDTKRLEAG